MIERIEPASDDAHYHLLKLLEQEPHLSQRELAKRLGVSLGKVNYCLRALLEKGWLKAENFRKSRNRKAYLYTLTPKGIAQKAALGVRFLKRKEAEYEALRHEIKALRREVAVSPQAITARDNSPESLSSPETREITP